ncbi:hypothetical protein, partial [Staphylococcus pseudintermedius]|uniref:hypothetical protein n=2 Tax=Staphylococcus pseudintermedius TaxID=283734 RepID=UPI001C6EE1D4
QCQNQRIQYTTMSKPTRHYNLKCIKNTASKPNVSQTPNVQNHIGKTTQSNTNNKKQQKLHSTKNIDIIKRHI